MKWLFVVAACTAVQLKQYACWALCRHDGSDIGWYEVRTRSCICGMRRQFAELTEPNVFVRPPVPTGSGAESIPKVHNSFQFQTLPDEEQLEP